MGGYSLLQAQRLFELVTRVLLPIGLWPVLREGWIGFSLELHLSRDEAFCLLSFGFVRTHKPYVVVIERAEGHFCPNVLSDDKEWL